MNVLRMMKGGIPTVDCCMEPKRPWHSSIPKDACWSFPDIFWNLFSESFCCFRIDLINLQISFEFFGGSWMVWFVPLMIHPINSFTASHVPSHRDRFFLEIEYSPWRLVTYGGGKIESMPWRRHRETWASWSMLRLFLAPINFSINTSMIVTKGLYVDGCVECCFICCSKLYSNKCGGRGFPILINFAMTLRDVSMIEQKKGGLSHQPIYRLLLTTVLMSSIEYTGSIKGRT